LYREEKGVKDYSAGLGSNAKKLCLRIDNGAEKEPDCSTTVIKISAAWVSFPWRWKN